MCCSGHQANGRFFESMHPHIGFLDTNLHTVPGMRNHSAILFTTVMAISVQTRQEEGD